MRWRVALIAALVAGRLEAGTPWIEASYSPGLAGPGAFQIRIDHSGQCSLQLLDRLSERNFGWQSFTLNSGSVRRIRLAIESEDYFHLGSSHGAPVIDGPERVIRIASGSRMSAVQLLHFDPSYPTTRAATAEARRALRVWEVIRGFIAYPEAADHRSTDRAYLEAAEASEDGEKTAAPNQALQRTRFARR